MCDTLGKLGNGIALFAKNSDRSPNEVQVLEYHERKQNLPETVNCTYISIPQVDKTYAVLLSRPVWMWGAEMGVNEFGLCIGNEAVFTKGAYGKTGLTGMDMVRLALERCQSAREALELLIQLLQTYGQGGNCGFDHDFYYDNAFLIMDRDALFVLETAGKQYTYKCVDAANISNRLSVGMEADACSGGQIVDFRKRYTEPVYTTFSGSSKRREQLASVLPGIATPGDCMAGLRTHNPKVKNPFAEGSVSSVCMHFGGLVGDHSTSSMVVSLEKDRILVWTTGSSLPCVSAFKPWLFGTEPVLAITKPDDPAGKAYWLEAEKFRRNLLGKRIPGEYFAQRDAMETRWLAEAVCVTEEKFPQFSQSCLEEETRFYETWKAYPFEKDTCSCGFRSRWQKKTAAMNWE